jgi:FMN phosphatase YigB (HAD superfamily)
MYSKIKDGSTVYFDVDDTLVMWKLDWDESIENQIVFIPDTSGRVPVLLHTKHIELLKRHKEAGDVVVVWSQGGSDWAEAVVKTLGIEEYVDVILTKPTKYYDDLPAALWLPPCSYEDFL